MTAIDLDLDDFSLDREHDAGQVLLPLLFGFVALALLAGFGAWFLSPPPPEVAVARAPAHAPLVATLPTASLFGAMPDFPQPLAPPARREIADDNPNPYGGLVDLFPGLRTAPAEPVQADLETTAPPGAAAPVDAPLPPKRDIARIDDDVPLPPPRPSEFAALEAPGAATAKFGEPRSLGPSLAYSAPDAAIASTPASPRNSSIFWLFGGRPTRPAGYDDFTAVYDISAKTLYMPDGTTIEAHSGLGPSMDDITQVGEHAKGPTPPDLYDLEPREEPFHGVAAIRLIPVGGEAAIYGREGLLAHPFMMGETAISNGCVSFKDYDAFLKAFQDGKDHAPGGDRQGQFLTASVRRRAPPPQCACSVSPRFSGLKRMTMTSATATQPATSASA